ncbi:hypothetical protein PACTADRAFT_49874 [Pachysolen tannophilus NRRL Y-2460]|uniref:MEMO1 family protein n=1 Tax=Pachysolen tannophilus NRRL Y-2460 TaxID=669874 RepID=A0A1E4TTQ2_PACTA|nr:hypothetical protein PACTADRAFT_49874 [Pachysolen tannophilus NRRL Y-2460]
MSIRAATHAGSWYNASESRLTRQMDNFLSNVKEEAIPGNRILIGPHAGYTYAGQTLAETYASWDISNVKRVFIMGPSHFVFFKNCVMLSNCEYYQTPFGDLEVDTKIVEQFISKDKNFFKTMSLDIDEEEHSFEMHLPFVYRMTQNNPQKPKIIPIMISHSSKDFENKLADYLLPFFEDNSNTFVISSDFCHWGSRFNYTSYLKGGDLKKIISLNYSSNINSNFPIYKSIEMLDKEAMKVISSGSYKDWKDYIAYTGNTVCGERPIGVLLNIIEKYKKLKGISGKQGNFKWLGYAQSGSVVDVDDSSVSYASGYCVI